MLDHLISSYTLQPAAMEVLRSYLVSERPQRILEFGGGVSTLFFATTARELGLDAAIVSVDHDLVYIKATATMLTEAGLRSRVHLCHAPIRPYIVRGRVYATYDWRRLRRLGGFGAQLVLVDGPPGHYRRDGALLAARRQIADGATVVLDDAHRPIEQEALDEWQRRFRAGIAEARLHDIHWGLAVFRLPSTRVRGWTPPHASIWSVGRTIRGMTGF